MSPEEAWTHHESGDLSGVNGTPLLRGIEFTHAPALAGEKDGWNGAVSKVEITRIYAEDAEVAESAEEEHAVSILQHAAGEVSSAVGPKVDQVGFSFRVPALKRTFAPRKCFYRFYQSRYLQVGLSGAFKSVALYAKKVIGRLRISEDDARCVGHFELLCWLLRDA
jgi:hypothetical protein